MDLKYFLLSEFDQRGLTGSGAKYMDRDFLRMIDNARGIAGIPFVINSGYRSKAYNEELKKQGYAVAMNSAHIKGKAADIRYNSISDLDKIIRGLHEAGFKRFGIARTYVHVDSDNSKPTPNVFGYSSTPSGLIAQYKPLVFSKVLDSVTDDNFIEKSVGVGVVVLGTVLLINSTK